MPFSIRPSRRFPLHRSATYNSSPLPRHSTIWNLSCGIENTVSDDLLELLT